MFLRKRDIDDLIESNEHLANVIADLIDVINRRAAALEAPLWSVPYRTTVGWTPPPRPTNVAAMRPEDVTASRTEALHVVDEVHRAQDRTDNTPHVDDDTPLIEKEACS